MKIKTWLTDQLQTKRDFQRLIKVKITRPAWAGFKTAEEGIAIIKSCIL